MPWPIRLFASFEEAYALYGNAMPVGAMWPDGDWLERYSGGKPFLSPEYHRDWAAKRPPLVVVLPDGNDFCIDSVTISDGVLGDHGWQVTGEAPSVTLSPSINVKGSYHGYIQNGVITDDCEGRTFPNARGFPT